MQISSIDADMKLIEIARQAQTEPVELMEDGRNVAVVLSMEEYRRLTMSTRDSFRDLSDRMSDYARARGMNEQVLAELLADDGA